MRGTRWSDFLRPPSLEPKNRRDLWWSDLAAYVDRFNCCGRYIDGVEEWPLALAYATGHWPTPDDLRPLAVELVRTVKQAADLSYAYSGAFRKYSSRKRYSGLSKSDKFQAAHLADVIDALATTTPIFICWWFFSSPSAIARLRLPVRFLLYFTFDFSPFHRVVASEPFLCLFFKSLCFYRLIISTCLFFSLHFCWSSMFCFQRNTLFYESGTVSVEPPISWLL